MIWKVPETEEAWEEYLSSYIDGELSPDDIPGLEDLLEKFPERAVQLKSLRSTSGFLKTWKIDAPVPDASFIREVRRQAGFKQEVNFFSWLRTLRLQTILPSFAVGLLAGIVMMSAFNKDSVPGNANTMALKHVAPEYTISQRQANELFAEVDAEGLKVKVLDELRKQNIDAALEAYKELKKKYPESRAFKELNENRKMRFLLS